MEFDYKELEGKEEKVPNEFLHSDVKPDEIEEIYSRERTEEILEYLSGDLEEVQFLEGLEYMYLILKEKSFIDNYLEDFLQILISKFDDPIVLNSIDSVFVLLMALCHDENAFYSMKKVHLLLLVIKAIFIDEKNAYEITVQSLEDKTDIIIKCLEFISEFTDNGQPLDADIYPTLSKVFKAVIDSNIPEIISLAAQSIYNLIKQSCKYRAVFVGDGMVPLLFTRVFCFESDCENCCLALSRLFFNLNVSDNALPDNWLECVINGFDSTLEINAISSYMKMISGIATSCYSKQLIGTNIAIIIFNVCEELTYDQKLSALDLIHDLIRISRGIVVNVIEEAGTLEMFDTFLDGDPPMLRKLFDILRDVVVEAAVIDPKSPPQLYYIFDESQSIMEAAEECSDEIDSAMFILTEMEGNRETIENG